MRGLLLAAGLGVLAVATPVHAQDYPTREVKLICGFVAGSGADIIHRFVAKQLQAISGRTFLVENRPGAAGNIASTFVSKAKPDGYTVYPVGGSALASSVHLYKQLAFDPVNDFEPVGTILKQGWLLVVDAKSPFKTLPELTAYLKEKKDKASYSTATTNGAVMGELYKTYAGLETVQVNYKTIGDSLNDLTSGNIDFAMADAAWSLGQIRNGRIRALAISTPERMKSMPDIPTMAEGGVPGVNLVFWFGVFVPKGTPQPIKDKLGEWVSQLAKLPDTEPFLSSIGTDVLSVSPDEAKELLRKDIENWGRYVKTANIKPN